MLRFVQSTVLGSFLAALAVASVGCGSGSPPPAQRLPGAWHGKMVVDKESVGSSLTPLQIADLERMEMGIEFTKEGAMVLSGVNNNQPYKSEGKWQFISQEGDQLTIKSLESDGTQKDVIILFDGTDKFHMPLKTEVANIGAMTFERLR
ncbi:hypothetical protein ETAA8_58840 [Anatilimnocola aggregata]|uniref:Lipocalin-like domain-containing protein n=1 Tax=Anatilimnocola aggregata TaxID=2528021 RepID=A0A517YKJ8_9BACT|nr:hypothetical protein [Anatilimnocola aggregata]QDU30736.1 hypothetical protein ETAA8_58840 [Anatilimnocola aggregata]